MADPLNATESRVRDLLVETAMGTLETRNSGLITYKELWQRISRKKWGTGQAHKIVRMILKIGVMEVSEKRPPLNELVVGARTVEPREAWVSIRRGLERKFRPSRDPHAVGLEGIGDLTVPYTSHQEAQKACWDYWGRKAGPNVSATDAEEGYEQDRTVTFRKRNAQLIKACKVRDDYTCQACYFRLQANGNFVIDCHHKNPLLRGERVTSIDDLICLCPTCHRVAHVRRPPLSVDEVREMRSVRTMAASIS